MCERATRDLDAYRRALQPSREAVWSTWAGAQLGAMKNSPSATVSYFTDKDTPLRLAAVSLVADYWPFNELFAIPCLRLAFEDPDSRVRGAAIASLRLKLHSFVQDPSGQFRKFLMYLRDLEPVTYDFALSVRQELKETCDWAHGQGQDRLRHLAGEHLAEISRSAPTAISYLSHPSANLRRAALLSLYYHFSSDFKFQNTCMRMIANDPDLDVRLEAQSILSTVFGRTDDVEVGRFLASIVRDASQATALRKDAYMALFIVRPMPVGRILQIAPPSFPFPEDVDWAFVDTF